MRENGGMTTQPNPNLLRGAADLAAVAAARQAQEQAARRKGDPTASTGIIGVTEARFVADVTQEYVQENPWRVLGVTAAVAVLVGVLISRR